MAKAKPKKSTKKSSRKLDRSGEVTQARVYVTATFNNTLVTFTDMAGNALSWSSAGSVGFKGSRKSTPFAATTAVDAAAQEAIKAGVREVEVYIKGPGAGRDASLRALKSVGLKLLMIADITPIAFNGPRPKKPRRV